MTEKPWSQGYTCDASTGKQLDIGRVVTVTFQASLTSANIHLRKKPNTQAVRRSDMYLVNKIEIIKKTVATIVLCVAVLEMVINSTVYRVLRSQLIITTCK